ncbi:MAG: Cof-type HAD-IIB family hydrolase [Bacteroidaceae bacterium]|nr:Cof-type HAD-IIB family hydrolase [Bacteroidaceae bacterium]
MIKAIFFDIDGTLVSFRTHKVSESTQKALKILRKKGIKTFIATGRHLRAINNLPGLEFDGYVTLNGGLCFGESGKLISQTSIPQEDLFSYLDYIEENPMPCVFVRKGDLHINYINQEVIDLFKLLDFIEVPTADLREIAKEDVSQLIAFFDQTKDAEVMTHLPNCTSTRWYHTFTDVVPKGICKSKGIAQVIEKLGIQREEIMAFGDGGNDIDMLQYAGIGVAMGNAENEVKEVADYLTDTVDNDGILKALEHFQIL